jgi:hypothetical protein
MTIYGYARVSTNGQDLSSQEAELLAAGCAKVFKEKVSGAKTDRAELAKVIRWLEPGDANSAKPPSTVSISRPRARANSRPYRRGQEARQGSWCAFRSSRGSNAAPTAGSDPEACAG